MHDHVPPLLLVDVPPLLDVEVPPLLLVEEPPLDVEEPPPLDVDPPPLDVDPPLLLVKPLLLVEPPLVVRPLLLPLLFVSGSFVGVLSAGYPPTVSIAPPHAVPTAERRTTPRKSEEGSRRRMRRAKQPACPSRTREITGVTH